MKNTENQVTTGTLATTEGWPTAEEVVQPIVAGLRRLNDLEGVGAELARLIESRRDDADALATAQAFVALVGDIAMRCRAAASACTPVHGAVAGASMDTVVRLVANDSGVVVALAERRNLG